jgi:hypothetical protein
MNTLRLETPWSSPLKKQQSKTKQMLQL